MIYIIYVVIYLIYLTCPRCGTIPWLRYIVNYTAKHDNGIPKTFWVFLEVIVSAVTCYPYRLYVKF